MAKMHCGDPVCSRESPRHTGRVIAIISGKVRVKWDGTCWISDEDEADIMHTEEWREDRVASHRVPNK